MRACVLAFGRGCAVAVACVGVWFIGGGVLPLVKDCRSVYFCVFISPKYNPQVLALAADVGWSEVRGLSIPSRYFIGKGENNWGKIL